MGIEKIRRRLSLRNARLTIPTVDAALTQVNMQTGATGDGDMRVGFSLGTVQLGVTVNGTAYILAGTPGGALSLGTAPAS